MLDKILLVFWGESFRSGSQMTRERGTRDYVKRQIIASKSHIRLIESLKSNHDVDVFINTYKLNQQDDTNLLSYYQKNSNVILNNFYDKIFPSEKDF